MICDGMTETADKLEWERLGGVLCRYAGTWRAGCLGHCCDVSDIGWIKCVVLGDQRTLHCTGSYLGTASMEVEVGVPGAC